MTILIRIFKRCQHLVPEHLPRWDHLSSQTSTEIVTATAVMWMRQGLDSRSTDVGWQPGELQRLLAPVLASALQTKEAALRRCQTTTEKLHELLVFV